MECGCILTTLDDLAKSTDVDVTRVCEIVSKKDQWDQMDNWQYEKDGQVKSWYYIKGHAAGGARIREEQRTMPDHKCDVIINCEPDHVIDLEGWEPRMARKIMKPEFYPLNVVEFGNMFKNLYEKFPKVVTGGATMQMIKEGVDMVKEANEKGKHEVLPSGFYLFVVDLLSEIERMKPEDFGRKESTKDQTGKEKLGAKYTKFEYAMEKVRVQYQDMEPKVYENCKLVVHRGLKSVQFILHDWIYDVAKTKLDMVHVERADREDDFNLYWYNKDRCVWDHNATHRLQKLGTECISGAGLLVKMDDKIARKMARQLSADVTAVRQIVIDDKYRVERLQRVYDTTGHYFDLKTGQVVQANPHDDYWESNDVRYALDDTLPEPKDFVEFLKTNFGTSWEIVRDHLAGMWLTGDLLHDNMRCLWIVGKSNTYKSLLVEYILAKILTDDKVSNSSLHALDEDKVFAMGNIMNRVLNWASEVRLKSVQHGEQFKDIITKEGGDARILQEGRRPAIRWPRWVLTCNKMPPIPQDDEDASIFKRYLIVGTSEKIKEKDWYAILNNDKSRRDIMMYLLKRAGELVKKPDSWKTQTESQVAEVYGRLQTNDIQKYIAKYCERTNDDTTGVAYIPLVKDIRLHVGSTLSKKAIEESLELMEFEKRTRVTCKPSPDGSLETYDLCKSTEEGVQRTLVMGLRMIQRASKPASRRVGKKGTKNHILDSQE